MNAIYVIPAELVFDPPEEKPSSGAKRVLRAIGAGLGRMSYYTAMGVEWIFGLVAVVVGLALLAAMPLAQFLTLGYLLEVSGRIGRTGRVTAGLVGVRKAARVGSIVAGVWLLLLPMRWTSSLWEAALLIDPQSPTAHHWEMIVVGLGLLLTVHGLAACFRGGRLRHFLWPFVRPSRLIRRLRRGGLYANARDAVWDFATGLRLPHYFWLGVRGFIGTLAWLIGPVVLLAGGQNSTVVGWIGALLLMWVISFLPLLQAHFAAENRFAALFELRHIRQLYDRAPLAWSLAIATTLLFAIPLYLLKIEIIPREAAWLPSLVFVIFILPARFVSGWAYQRSLRHEFYRHRLSRWFGRLVLLPIAAFYVLILFLTQFTAWNGALSLYEQHAFLVPVPFLEM